MEERVPNFMNQSGDSDLGFLEFAESLLKLQNDRIKPGLPTWIMSFLFLHSFGISDNNVHLFMVMIAVGNPEFCHHTSSFNILR